MKELSAGAIIYLKEKGSTQYLLLQYGAGHWDFAKGHVEKNESEEETVRREAKEEAGLSDLRLVPGFRERISYFFRKNGRAVAKEVVFLLAETKTKKVKLSFEHSGYCWLGFEEAVKKTTYSSGREVLKKAEKFLRKRANRTK